MKNELQIALRAQRFPPDSTLNLASNGDSSSCGSYQLRSNCGCVLAVLRDYDAIRERRGKNAYPALR